MAHAGTIAIVVHGGAWAIPDDERGAAEDGARRAAAAGYAVLAGGGTALDAVEAAVRVLEDDPVFDAGYGSVLNSAGCVEMDAVVVDGATLAIGAVVGIDNVRHPVTVARRVMQTTPHCMLAGEGAKAFAAACGEPVVEPSNLVTPGARAEWALMGDYKNVVTKVFDNPPHGSTNSCQDDGRGGSSGGTTESADAAAPAAAPTGHDTVGAVALDAAGNLAAATSTGGITRKLAGRVGDSALFGCGAYAENGVGACSTTGHGESIMKVLLARRSVEGIGAAIATHGAAGGAAVAAAGKAALEYMRARVNGYGGVILLAPDGGLSVVHSTARMAWAYAKGTLATDSEPAAASSGATSTSGVGGAGAMPVEPSAGATPCVQEAAMQGAGWHAHRASADELAHVCA
jgi:beta-aspartyl-peptidase (threonine type)